MVPIEPDRQAPHTDKVQILPDLVISHEQWQTQVVVEIAHHKHQNHYHSQTVRHFDQLMLLLRARLCNSRNLIVNRIIFFVPLRCHAIPLGWPLRTPNRTQLHVFAFKPFRCLELISLFCNICDKSMCTTMKSNYGPKSFWEQFGKHRLSQMRAACLQSITIPEPNSKVLWGQTTKSAENKICANLLSAACAL